MVWQPECYSTNERWNKSKNCEEFEMAIQKKSLISNRTATKKALVAKPEAATVAPTRFKAQGLTRVKTPAGGLTRVKTPAGGLTRIKTPAGGLTRIKTPAGGLTRVKTF
jgi:hypothetical protein